MQHTINKTVKKKKKERSKLVRKSGKTVKLSIQTLQMLHYVSNITINKTFKKKSGKIIYLLPSVSLPMLPFSNSQCAFKCSVQ